ncbi:MAG: phytoene synthase [Frankiales bacterium]|nr:phytoene synthase [Frankiales bacterium]
MSLDAAGIHAPALRSSYDACRRLNAEHGRTYYLATLLLPSWKRPYVHALYGFARHVDEIVDDLSSALTPAQKAAELAAWTEGVLAGRLTHPIAAALRDTLHRWDIPLAHVEQFLRSMQMDLTVGTYKTYDDLTAYVHGSAAVIGLQMLPVLEAVVPLEIAAPYAADLGIAFQLTNFLRDIGEDLRRDRVYLPQEDLDVFGVTVEQLAAGVVDGRFRRLMAFEIARTRETYRTAALGVRLLHPTSRPCITTALRLYAGILDEIEKADYRVLDRRVSVSPARRLAVAAPAAVRTWRAGPRTTTS